MHLKINDFKKAGWSIGTYHAVKTVCDEENNLAYIQYVEFDDGLNIYSYRIDIANTVVNSIEIQIDNISTIEELEKTAKDLYLAIKGLE